MKYILSYFILSLCFWLSPSLYAQNNLKSDSIFVYCKNGGLDVYPGDVLNSTEETDTQLKMILKGDSSIIYEKAEVDSLGGAPKHFPEFTVFKFNNKYNENLYTDVFATIGSDEITATVGAIGKSLTPSFQLNDAHGKVYVEGKLQQSKVSRHRFDQPVEYILGYENYRQLKYFKVQDEIWSEAIPAKPILEKIPLRAEMFMTNLPGRPGEGFEEMLDNDKNTFFHSSWGNTSYHDINPYLEIHLDQAVSDFAFSYITRPDCYKNYCPLEFYIQGSNDGKNWSEGIVVNEKDGMPASGCSQEYTSSKLNLGNEYSYLRFTLNRSGHRKYLVLAEFALHKCVGEKPGKPAELISAAVYRYLWKPYGKELKAKVDWLTDHANNVPRIDISLGNGQTIESINKEMYLDATIEIRGEGVFPDLPSQSVQIKGRGNSTWHGSTLEAKNPYRLKFPISVKPFGLKKGKNWVLLANAINGSMLTNAIGMKIARMVGTASANDIVPVELYINNDYRGHYNFTQHVGLHNNSVDVDETNAVMLELDTYYDEKLDKKPRFTSISYQLPCNIKAPDFQELPLGSVLNEKMVISNFDAFETDLKNDVEDLEKWYDPVMLAKYFLVNELIDNEELKHPKSCFLYREDLIALHSRYIFGPVWDLDWAYGYEHGSYCPNDYTLDYFEKIKNHKGGAFYYDLRQREAVKRAYYQVWMDFMKRYIEEIPEYINDYYAYVQPSLEHNQEKWKQSNNYDVIADKFSTWLTARGNHIYNELEKFDLDKPLPIKKGDVNVDGFISIADVVCAQNYLLDLPNESFDYNQADANSDGQITVTDMVCIVALAMQSESNTVRHMALPTAQATMCPLAFSAALGITSELPIELNLETEKYSAAQFDVTLPEGMSIEHVDIPEMWKNVKCEWAKLMEGKYRVVLYVENGDKFPVGQCSLQLVVRTSNVVEQSARVVSLNNIILATQQGEDERLCARSVIFNMEVTGVDDCSQMDFIKGGDVLTIETLHEGQVRVYTIDGRLFRVCRISVGLNRIQLPAGVYIINQKKVLVH